MAVLASPRCWPHIKSYAKCQYQKSCNIMIELIHRDNTSAISYFIHSSAFFCTYRDFIDDQRLLINIRLVIIILYFCLYIDNLCLFFSTVSTQRTSAIMLAIPALYICSHTMIFTGNNWLILEEFHTRIIEARSQCSATFSHIRHTKALLIFRGTPTAKIH